MEDDKLTAKRAAAHLDVSVSTIYRLARDGLIQTARASNGRRRFVKQSLDDYAVTKSKGASASRDVAPPPAVIAAPVETNRVITGDCLEVMATLPDECLHLAITSPPYNVGIEYDGHHDQLEYDVYRSWLRKVWAETKRVLVPGGRFALNVAPTSIKNFRPMHYDLSRDLMDLDMIMRTEILWYKQTIYRRTAWGSWRSPSNPHIMPSWEYVLVFSKDTWTLEGSRADADITSEEFKYFSDGFWYIQPETQRKGHPSPFPEELIYRLIKFYTYKDNVVLDMFGGTGTVAVVALKTGRRFIHIDASAEYNDITARRLRETEAEMRQQHLFSEEEMADGALVRQLAKRRKVVKKSRQTSHESEK